MINLLRWCARIAGIGALVLGVARHTGTAHFTLGGVVAAALAILGIMALSARVRIPLAGVAVIWAICTVYVGVMQTRWMPGSTHWIIQAVHAALGIGAIGVAEALAGAITRQRA